MIQVLRGQLVRKVYKVSPVRLVVLERQVQQVILDLKVYKALLALLVQPVQQELLVQLEKQDASKREEKLINNCGGEKVPPQPNRYTDKIRVYASTANLTFTAYGSEIS